LLFSARRRRRRAVPSGKFPFLDLWIKFGKIISKAHSMDRLY